MHGGVSAGPGVRTGGAAGGPGACGRQQEARSGGTGLLRGGTHLLRRGTRLLRGRQQEQKSDASRARALECETSLGAICGHTHSRVQRQALGGWEPPGDLGLLSSWGPRGAGGVLRCLKRPVAGRAHPCREPPGSQEVSTSRCCLPMLFLSWFQAWTKRLKMLPFYLK